MKLLIAAAGAIGLAAAAQAQDPATADPMPDPHIVSQSEMAVDDMNDWPDAEERTRTMIFDPRRPLEPPAYWTDDQRRMFGEHLAFHPAHWSAGERAAFERQLRRAPGEWTPGERILYWQHMAALPESWTDEQRGLYARQLERSAWPWMSGEGMGGPYEEVGEDWRSHADQENAIGDPPTDPADTAGAGLIRDNQRGMDADAPLIEDEPDRPD